MPKSKKSLRNSVSWWLLIIALPIYGASTPLLQQLKTIEIARSELTLNYEKTLKEIAKQETTLNALTQNQIADQTNKQAEHNALASQITQVYQLHQSDPLKALLNQDDPTKIKRLLTYQRYLLNYRLTTNHTIAPQIPNQEQISILTNKLELLKTQQIKQHQELEKLNQARATILATPNFTPNHPSNLEKLLTNFNLSINKNLARKAAMRPLCVKKFSPTEGYAEKFQRKNSGILITAPENQDVHAIANGRIIFADWLAGYGLLIIIDHGRGFVSIYGRNRNLYKKTNNSVRAGEIIATVGNTGGYQTPALYFAIRYNKNPMDPERWCKNQF